MTNPSKKEPMIDAIGDLNASFNLYEQALIEGTSTSIVKIDKDGRIVQKPIKKENIYL